ncbi:fibrinogen C domain-containing protein 1-A-like [Dysidea avara]|uniref:fibrinogen C domain-containing protein 1-A-like n=1 Tax=Dysidea avara TaxID=196820 RepID=UPI003328AC2C
MITLVVLVSLELVLVDGECDGPIDNCCLGYNNNNYNEEEDGLSFRGDKMEVLTLRIEIGYNMKMDLVAAFMFAVGPAEDQYQLSISGFDSVGLPDPFSTYGSMDGMKFSSRDHDNDLWSSNCAQHRGGWWHRSCGDIMLNNNYNTIHLNDRWHVLPFVEIKIRPFNCDK